MQKFYNYYEDDWTTERSIEEYKNSSVYSDVFDTPKKAHFWYVQKEVDENMADFWIKFQKEAKVEEGQWFASDTMLFNSNQMGRVLVRFMYHGRIEWYLQHIPFKKE